MSATTKTSMLYKCWILAKIFLNEQNGRSLKKLGGKLEDVLESNEINRTIYLNLCDIAKVFLCERFIVTNHHIFEILINNLMMQLRTRKDRQT